MGLPWGRRGRRDIGEKKSRRERLSFAPDRTSIHPCRPEERRERHNGHRDHKDTNPLALSLRYDEGKARFVDAAESMRVDP
jgi:hypothetical protein